MRFVLPRFQPNLTKTEGEICEERGWAWGESLPNKPVVTRILTKIISSYARSLALQGKAIFHFCVCNRSCVRKKHQLSWIGNARYSSEFVKKEIKVVLTAHGEKFWFQSTRVGPQRDRILAALIELRRRFQSTAFSLKKKTLPSSPPVCRRIDPSSIDGRNTSEYAKYCR